MDRLKVAVIGCTVSTLRCLELMVTMPEVEVVGIITLAATKAGTKSRFVPLHPFAEKHSIKVFDAEKTNDPAVLAFLQSLNADYLLEVGWSHWIGKEILAAAKHGTIGLHNSYLPKNQGAASLNWAIIRDEKTWGTTLFHLAENIDAGDIIARREYPVEDTDDVNSLFDKADVASVDMLREMLPKLLDGTSPRIAQDQAEVTNLPRRKPEDGEIHWKDSARTVWNLIRALKKPYPPAFAFLNGKKVLVCDATLSDAPSPGPGVLAKIDDGITIGAGDCCVLLKTLEIEGETEMTAADFATRYTLHVSDSFDVR